jgi:hypothetical protein
MFDKFFDFLNTRSLTEATRRRKPDVAPYKSINDPRLKVCIRILYIIINNAYSLTTIFTQYNKYTFNLTLQWLKEDFVGYLDKWP